MRLSKPIGILALLLIVGAAVAYVATQGSDPTGLATGLAPADGIIPVQSDLAERVTVFPAPGATDVPVSWDGNEVPQPTAPPKGYPSGPVITVQQQDHQLEIGSATITEHGSDMAIPATLFVNAEDTNLPTGTSGLIPHEPLAAQTTYKVVFSDFVGAPVAAWTFTTGAAECDPTAQDCGRGQACYVLNGAPVCTWAGSLSKSQPCSHLNECGPGLSCFRGRCEPYCDASESADPDISCTEQCGQGGFDIPGMEQSDTKVCLDQNCLLEAIECPEGEACYRFNDLYLCDKAGEAAVGSPCQYPNDCVANASCMGIDGVFTCMQLCDGPGMPACQEVCSRGERTIFTSPLVRYCR